MAESAEEVWEKIKSEQNRESFSTAWKVMDENMNLYNQVQYQMKDYQGKPVARVHPVTLPDFTNFANRVHTVTGGVLPQIKIRSKEMDEAIKAKAQNFLYGAFDEANNILLNQGEAPFHSDLAFYGETKSMCAMKCQVVLDSSTNTTRFDYIPIDPRYFVYKLGYKGPIWAAWWRVKDADQIMTKYPDAKVEGLDITVHEYWDDEQNIVFANGEEIFSQPNAYLKPPVIISPLKNDIFQHQKGTYELMNMVSTILMTTSMQSLRSAMELKSERNFKVKPQYPGMGSVNVTKPSMGEEWRVIPLPDVYQATAFMWNVLSSAFQRGTYAFIEYGGIEFPLSSLALTNLAQGRDQVIFPLLQSLTRGYRQACDMTIKQFKEGHFSATLGEDEMIEKYTAGDLPDPGDDCNIKFVFKTTTVSEEGAAYQMAAAALDIIPFKDILENIIKVDNAVETEHRIWLERGYRDNPSLRNARILEAMEYFGLTEQIQLLSEEIEQVMEGQEGMGDQGLPTGAPVGAGAPGGNGSGGGPPTDMQMMSPEGV